VHERAGSHQEGSLAMTLQRLAAAGIANHTIAAELAQCHVSPVLTAHPTEVQRKSILDAERGIAQLLAPVPKMQEQKRDENRYFNGPANVALQGAAVPVGYGRCVVGSVLVSAGITVIDENMSNSNGLFKFGDPRNVTALFGI